MARDNCPCCDALPEDPYGSWYECLCARDMAQCETCKRCVNCCQCEEVGVS